MVRTLGRGRMATMVRLLVVGTPPEKNSEEGSHEKIAVQAILRELQDADEANFLEEDDMNVFDSRPMMDPLHLVCCKGCKKPIKASRYAAHAESCRSLNSLEDTALVLDSCSRHKKPPRKGKKNSQGANDIPFPLATKNYHSQNNHRLRLALGFLYHGASAKEYGHDFKSPEVLQERTVLSSHVTPSSKPLHEIQARSSELCLEASGGLQSSINVSNQSRENGFSEHGLQVTGPLVDMVKARYYSATYSYSRNTGAALGTMQQVNRKVSNVVLKI